MKIPSVTFGELEIEPNEIYFFEDGIPGLKGIQKWFLVDNPDLAPFKWLQACEPGTAGEGSPYLSLMLLDPIYINPDYNVKINRDQVDALGGVDDPTQLLTYVIIVVPKNPKDMTANLLAPLVLNPGKRRGMQVVVEGHRKLLRVKVIKDS